jgi:hypothetical protein
LIEGTSVVQQYASVERMCERAVRLVREALAASADLPHMADARSDMTFGGSYLEDTAEKVRVAEARARGLLDELRIVV